MNKRGIVFASTLLLMVPAAGAHAQRPMEAPAAQQRELLVIDTDIGDDFDDMVAVGLALSSPRANVIGVTAGWGNTQLRGRMLDRLLMVTGRETIPVGVGTEKHHAGEAAFSQANWAKQVPERPHRSATDVILSSIRAHPGEVTLVSLAPMTNLAEAFAKDPATFRRLKRIVMMGGSVRSGYEQTGSYVKTPPGPEYNIEMDTDAAAAVLRSGVPLYVMPLDSTQLKLDEVKRVALFTQGMPLTDALALTYLQWSAATYQQTPTLYDAVAVAYAIDPATCPATPLRIRFSSDGRTHEEPGQPNSQVCLQSREESFFNLLMPTLLNQTPPTGTAGAATQARP